MACVVQCFILELEELETSFTKLLETFQGQSEELEKYVLLRYSCIETNRVLNCS